jgi:glycerol-3-phosphate acyltransferase PlsY
MAIAAALIAYLIGSISFAVIVSRALGLPDPRSYGSKNPGAPTLRGGKSLPPLRRCSAMARSGAVFLTEIIFRSAVVPSYKMSLVAIAVVLGHMYPRFNAFRE